MCRLHYCLVGQIISMQQCRESAIGDGCACSHFTPLFWLQILQCRSSSIIIYHRPTSLPTTVLGTTQGESHSVALRLPSVVVSIFQSFQKPSFEPPSCARINLPDIEVDAELRAHLSTMDVILEVADTYLLDRVYATLLPASPAQYISYKSDNASSLSFSNATGSHLYNYIYEPASQYISLEPTQWTYSSSWPRDNIIRQGISLFAIVW